MVELLLILCCLATMAVGLWHGNKGQTLLDEAIELMSNPPSGLSSDVLRALVVARRALDAWGHDEHCARVQARFARVADAAETSFACDCNIESDLAAIDAAIAKSMGVTP